MSSFSVFQNFNIQLTQPLLLPMRFCILIIVVETAAMNRQNEEQNRLGPILTCENEWCTYTAQVDSKFSNVKPTYVFDTNSQNFT